MKLHYTATQVKHWVDPTRRQTMCMSTTDLCEDYLQLWDEVKRLQAKLSKTADGVWMAIAEDVWHPEYGLCDVICDHRARPNASVHYETIVPVAECYSTCEAVEAAGGET